MENVWMTETGKYPGRLIIGGLFLFLLFLYDSIYAKEMENHYMASKPQVLNVLSGNNYDSAETFIDSIGRPIIVCSFGITINNTHAQQIAVFVLDNEKWIDSTNVVFGYPIWHGMVSKGEFKAYAICIPQAKDFNNTQIISIYSLDPNSKLSSTPEKTIQMDSSNKVFDKEEFRLIKKFLPLTFDNGGFFVIGKYTELRLNTGTFFKRLLSGGHGGYADRMFGAIIKGDKINRYFNASGEVKTNEYISRIHSITEKGKVHVAWLRGREFSNDPMAVLYSYFDIANNQWAESIELFSEYPRSKKRNQFLDGPFLAHCDKMIYCAWSLTVFDTMKSNWPINLEESGIYVCSKTGDSWGKPVKLAESGIDPQIITDCDNVYAFWVERDKGLFYKYKSKSGWSRGYEVVKDTRIKTKEIGLAGSPTHPYGISLDQDNNFHIVYIRENPIEMKGKTSEELIYVKLAQINANGK